jgi:hypothetical protein
LVCAFGLGFFIILDSIFLHLLLGEDTSILLHPSVSMIEVLLLEAEVDDLRFWAPYVPDVFFNLLYSFSSSLVVSAYSTATSSRATFLFSLFDLLVDSSSSLISPDNLTSNPFPWPLQFSVSLSTSMSILPSSAIHGLLPLAIWFLKFPILQALATQVTWVVVVHVAKTSFFGSRSFEVLTPPHCASIAKHYPNKVYTNFLEFAVALVQLAAVVT